MSDLITRIDIVLKRNIDMIDDSINLDDLTDYKRIELLSDIGEYELMEELEDQPYLGL